MSREEIIYWLAIVYAVQVPTHPSQSDTALRAVVNGEWSLIRRTMVECIRDARHLERCTRFPGDPMRARIRDTVAGLLREALRTQA